MEDSDGRSSLLTGRNIVLSYYRPRTEVGGLGGADRRKNKNYREPKRVYRPSPDGDTSLHCHV